MQADANKNLLQEMQWIRKLLMLQTLAVGYKQKDLAQALGISEATMSRMMPKGLSKTTSSNRIASNSGSRTDGD